MTLQNQTTTEAASARVVQLDLIRCLAVVLVLGRHMAACPPETSYWLWAATSVWKRGGWIGVDLFFVLSGFLVSGLLFREFQKVKTVNVGRFLIRRGFKIYPAFWVMLGVTVAVRLTLDGKLSTRALTGELLFVQNYLDSFWNHTWSLAVEEHFYLLLALLTVWLCRRADRVANPFSALPGIFVGVATACFCLRLLMATTRPYAEYTHLFPTHLRIDSLLFGVLISYYWHFGGLARNARWSRHAPLLAAAGCALLAPAFVFPLERTPWIPAIGLTGFYLGSGAILLAMLYLKIPDNSVTRSLGAIGMFSYSIYLWHMPVETWAVPIIETLFKTHLNWVAYAVIYFVGAIAVGILTAKAIEYPLLRVRDRFFPSQSPRVTPTPVATLSVTYASGQRG